MKKFIAITSMLTLFAVSSGLFAQEEEKAAPALKFSGEYVTGVSIQTPNEGDTQAVWWHDDAGASRLRLNLLYESDVGGVKGRIQQTFESAEELNKHVAWGGWAYGWVNLLDKMVVISAGQIDDANWGTGGVADVSFDGVKGTRLAIAPIEGLSLGAAVPFSASGEEVSLPFKNMNFGAKYKASAFTAVFNLKLNDNNADDKNTGVDLAFGVNVPLGAITIDLTGYFADGDVINKDKIVAHGDVNMPGFLIGPKVSFAQDAISAYAQLNAKIDLKDDDGLIINTTEEDGDASVGFEVGGSYKVNSVLTPSLSLGSDNVAYLDLNGIWLKFGADFNLGNGITVTVFDKIRRIGADEDVYGTESKVNQVQVNFKWAF